MKPSIFKLHTQITMGEHPHVVFIAPHLLLTFFLPICTKCSWGKKPTRTAHECRAPSLCSLHQTAWGSPVPRICFSMSQIASGRTGGSLAQDLVKGEANIRSNLVICSFFFFFCENLLIRKSTNLCVCKMQNYFSLASFFKTVSNTFFFFFSEISYCSWSHKEFTVFTC